MADADKILRQYHEHVVEVDDKELIENQTIAKAFVNDFINFVRRTTGLQSVEMYSQGSSFEGLKVGKPDEFDFLIIFLSKKEDEGFKPPMGHPLKTKIEEYRDKSGKLRCYHPILMPDRLERENAIYAGMQELWLEPGKYKCLSAKRAIETFMNLLKEYKRGLKREQYRLTQGLSGMEVLRFGKCNLKVNLVKTNGDTMKVDMSPAVRLWNKDSGKYLYYIAKKHPEIGDPSIQKDHLELLWLDCFSPEEQQLIEKKTDAERENYRIVKSLLGECVPEAYIWKTIFMLADRPLPVLQLQFVNEMVVRFHRALIAERQRRDPDQPPLARDQENNLLISKFNRLENVLARFSDTKIDRWYEEFSRLKQLLEARDTHTFLRKLMGTQEYKRMENFAAFY